MAHSFIAVGDQLKGGQLLTQWRAVLNAKYGFVD